MCYEVPDIHAAKAEFEAMGKRVLGEPRIGAHGTLEWLPGKSVALSADCWPEALTGALPILYPFIVNDPGEAAQAKRRIGAVTIGHLPPPMLAIRATTQSAARPTAGGS